MDTGVCPHDLPLTGLEIIIDLSEQKQQTYITFLEGAGAKGRELTDLYY